MAQCPRCKEDMPLLSKICPCCGYVIQGDGKTPTAEEFIILLAQFLHDIKIIPQPSFFKSMGQLSIITLPIISLFLLAMAIISEAGLFWILFGIFLALSIWAIIKKSKGNLGNEQFNKQFKILKTNYEYHEQIAKMHFGKNQEVAKLMNDISAQITDIEMQRDVRNRRNLLVWIVLIALFCGAASTGVFSVNKALNGVTQEEPSATTSKDGSSNKWNDIIEEFKKTPEAKDEHLCNKYAQEILMMLCNANEWKLAEDLFFKTCMGKPNDYKCAEILVLYYTVQEKDKEKAEKFIEKCDNMRYKSDVNKLKKLIK